MFGNISALASYGRLLLGTLLLFGVVLGLLANGANALELNPEPGDPVFKPFSVFGPPDEGQQRVVVVFHGFLSAVPNGTYKRVYKKLRKTHRVIGINYDPRAPAQTFRFLQGTVAPALAGKSVSVLGTSLGAWWAWHFGHHVNAERIVMLNPVVEPGMHLLKHLDKTYPNPRRKAEYSLTRDSLIEYLRAGDPRPSPASQLVILSRDDDVLDYRAAELRFSIEPNTRFEIYEEGGHTIPLKRHVALKRIVRFIREGV